MAKPMSTPKNVTKNNINFIGRAVAATPDNISCPPENAA